jgi:hypothetical protein
LEDFAIQRFDRGMMDYWLKEIQLTSVFEFGDTTTATSPEARRLKVRELMEKHQGNKAAVARELGITRQRVGQLIGDRNVGRKALRPTAQDPFGLVRNSKEDHD